MNILSDFSHFFVFFYYFNLFSLINGFYMENIEQYSFNFDLDNKIQVLELGAAYLGEHPIFYNFINKDIVFLNALIYLIW